jgi:hypothetical protein
MKIDLNDNDARMLMLHIDYVLTSNAASEDWSIRLVEGQFEVLLNVLDQINYQLPNKKELS